MKLPEPRDPDRPYAICVVCMGNICRSPIGEVVLRSKLEDAGLGDRVVVDSAGLGGWHAGDPMDRRSRAVLVAGGFDRTEHRARQFSASWFENRDLILGMDDSNIAGLRRLATRQDDRERVGLFGAFGHVGQVPDPYYGDRASFEEVLELVLEASDVLVGRLARTLGRVGTGDNRQA